MKNTTATWVLIGLLLGIACGLFLGEYAGHLSVIGDIFVGLLQMTVLPYIAVAIVTNVGRLSLNRGKQFGLFAGLFYLLSAVLTLISIVVFPLCLPDRQSATFFSTGILAEPAEIDFLSMFIPSNPFHSLANNFVPAVVLFCIALGVAVMTLPRKALILEQLDVIGDALGRVNHYLVRLAPVGIFAITANLAGTMRTEGLSQLNAYLVLNLVITLLLGYGVLLAIIAALTPFSYRELIRVTRTPVITALVTGKVFIVLPMIVEAVDELFERLPPQPGEPPGSHIRAVTALAYPFPHAGRLLALLFVPFAAWFLDIPVTFDKYPAFLIAGSFSLFGSPVAAMPFLLNMFRLPADMFELFLASGTVTSHLGDMLGAIHIFFIAVLTTAALTRHLRTSPSRLLTAAAFPLLIGAIAFGSTQVIFSASLTEKYTKDEIVLGMQSSLHSAPATVHRTVPDMMPRDTVPVMRRVSEHGVLRVGYHADNLPMTFFNGAGELVGHDIDMVSLLAAQMACSLEFVPFEFSTLVRQLDEGQIDVAVSGIGMLPERLTQVAFSQPYFHATIAIVVPDHRRNEMIQRMTDRNFAGTSFAVARSDDAAMIAAALLPGAASVTIGSIREYCVSGGEMADGMIWFAESGAAWTLLYPGFSVVPIRPLYQLPVGFVFAKDNAELASLMDKWITIYKSGSADERLYDYWILGKSAERWKPRWSVIRDVLQWVD